jgi:hypothetical protein
VKLLRSGLEVRFEQDGKRLEFTIPSIANYEIAAVSFL